MTLRSLLGRVIAFLAMLGVLIFNSACDARQISSEAYQLGMKSGADWRELATEVQVLSVWAEEELGENLSIPETEKRTACRAMWLIIGWPTFGLQDSSGNRSDFIDGCMSTVGG